ncbi:MAG: phenylalanine--tRNA ligase subunit beta [Bacteroidota bacterium]
MTISYNWLCDYLPQPIEPERLGKILTSIGLEVEKQIPFEEVKGGLAGVVVGKVLEVTPHPNADRLRLTRVDVGEAAPLHIVCGAPNVAVGQTVLVAKVGATIYPTQGDPITLKKAKIRGEESMGMICAEDELGMGQSHEGIMILPDGITPGTPAADHFNPYSDIVFEIGLTPNRMDAMSHWGVARDVCAYLSHHERTEYRPKLPAATSPTGSNVKNPIEVDIENGEDCPRYCGISLKQVTVGDSPLWMQQRLKAIGVRPINNLVDITNYLLHETGQPLHAFDADKIRGGKIQVKKLAAGTSFITLDDKVRSLHQDDLMICDTEGGLCLAGVFGGKDSGVTDQTTNLFLESACFGGIGIRKTSFRHGLRTDAALRFEKGTDPGLCERVLLRAVQLIQEIAGGEVVGSLIDLYPGKKEKNEIALSWQYLKKLSGKNYHPEAVRNILVALGFEILRESDNEFRVAVPTHKPDIEQPADLVEEILRIDGLDNIPIPTSIRISPSVASEDRSAGAQERIADRLAGLGFQEIVTNSITNSAYFTEEESKGLVQMINSLSQELNVMRPRLLETALEVVAHNLNHKNGSLRLFEFGKIYSYAGGTDYHEAQKLALVWSGDLQEGDWKQSARAADLYSMKSQLVALFQWLGLDRVKEEYPANVSLLKDCIHWIVDGKRLAEGGEVPAKRLTHFGIKQPVFYAEMDWTMAMKMALTIQKKISPLPKFPAVQRDLSMVVDRSLSWAQIEHTVQKIGLENLQRIKLFDIFESDKLGTDKRSTAVNLIFQHPDKTLTDAEIDGWMQQVMLALSNECGAEIRK